MGLEETGTLTGLEQAGRATFTEGYHGLEDGLRLSYRDYAPAGASGKDPVVCLHGLSRNARDFEDVAPAIAAAGRRAIVPSMRGRGLSSWDPRPERYSIWTYVADVRGLLDALAIPRAVFIGTSMGGIISMALAAADPRRVAAVVLNDVGAEIDPAGLDRIKGYVGTGKPARTWEEAAERAREVNGHAFPKEDREFWLAFARRTRREEGGLIVSDYDPAIGDVTRNTPLDTRGLWPLYDALAATPTLLVRGAISDLLSPETVAGMRARKPDLEVVEVPDVGHAPMLTEPDAAAAVARFLREVE